LEFILKKHPDKLIVFCDEYSVVQIFVNLIESAIKYTDKGFVEVSSDVNKAGNVVIKVADSGIGMPEEYLADLFTPFTQEEQGYTRKYEGNGLGLALVKKYCEMNNAQIFVESVKGKRTTFTVVFNSLEKL
jgi:signal transduction histidine kinase